MPAGGDDQLFRVLARIPAARLHEVVPRLDGLRLVADCARHGVSAYVARGLDAEGLRLPPDAQAALVNDARASIAATMRIRRLLHAVLDALAPRGVRPVVLKGIGLGVRLYGDPLLRPSTDVDVLVRPHELPAVREALAALGLAEEPDETLADVFEEHHHLSFSSPGRLVEVHFRLFSSFGRGAFSDDEVRGGCVGADLDGRAVAYLGPEVEFVYLAAHAANHAFLRASWLVDLQRFLLAHRALRWQEMADIVHRAGFTSAVTAALDTIERTLDVTLPPAAREAFPSPRWRLLVNERLFSAANLSGAGIALGRVSNFLVRLWLVDDPWRGVRHVADGARRFARRVRSRRAG